MSQFLFFTDPHLGKNLSAHTNAASRAYLKRVLFDMALAVTASAVQPDPQPDLICTGDLFDTYSNDEETISQGATILRRCRRVLAGNHDVVNNADKLGSLQLLDRLLGNESPVVRTSYGKADIHLDGPFVMIPHVATKALFEAALADAEQYAKNHPYLLLHCNYNSEFATSDISLNLSKPEAQRLLDAGFKRILIGHEHQPREDFAGRVIVIGNLHPTGFADISDKRVVWLDTETDKVEFRWIWSAKEGYGHLTVAEFLAAEINPDSPLAFLKVSGEIAPSELGPYAKKVKEAWSRMENLIALRSEVTVMGGTNSQELNSTKFSKVTDRIEAELADNPELLALWKEIAPVTLIEAE